MPKVYHGQDAVDQAARYYGVKSMSPIARHIVIEEGFVPGVYKDSKGIPTEGVGLTGDYVGKNFFTEVMPVFEEKARTTTKDWDKLPEDAQAAIVSMAYRGDWGKNTRRLLSEGKWKEAAKEYLNHDEYREGKGKDATSAQRAISERMERNAQTIFNLGTSNR